MNKKIFLLKTEEKNWLKIIIWWELRRILYNVILVIFGLLSLTILSFIIKDIWSFFSPPFFFFMLITIFMIFANIFYTSGWIFQLLFRKSKNRLINKVKPKIFIYGLFITAFITFLPCFISGIYTIVSGERIKSAYGDFSTEKPNIKDIYGEYKLSEKTKKELNISEIESQKIKIRFYDDGIFEFENYPQNEYGRNFSDFENINANGKWKLDLDQENWVLSLKFEKIINCKTGNEEKDKYYYNSYNLTGEKPPYGIYIMIGDPDSWEGIILEKK
jgi:hypothetical protein